MFFSMISLLKNMKISIRSMKKLIDNYRRKLREDRSASLATGGKRGEGYVAGSGKLARIWTKMKKDKGETILEFSEKVYKS